MAALNLQKEKVALLTEQIKSLKSEYESKIHELNQRVHKLTLKCGELQFDRTMKPYIPKVGSSLLLLILIEAINQPGKKRKRDDENEGGDNEEKEFNMNLLHALEQETIFLKQNIKDIESEVERKNKTILEANEKLADTEKKLKKVEDEFENFKKSPISTDFPEKLKKMTEAKEKLESQLGLLKSENERLVTDHNHRYLLKCCEAEGLVKQSKSFKIKIGEMEKNFAQLQKEQVDSRTKESLHANEMAVSEYKSRIQASDARIEELKSEIQILTENIQIQNNNYHDEVKKQKEAYEKEISDLKKKMSSTVDNEIPNHLKTIQNLHDQLKSKETEFEKHTEELKKKNEHLASEMDILNRKLKENESNAKLHEEITKLKAEISELKKTNEIDNGSRKRKTREDDEYLVDMKKQKVHKQNPIVVLFSGFNAKQKIYKDEMKEKLSRYVKELKGTVATAEEDPTITHVVVPPGVRTYKALIAALKNKWIMDPKWIEVSKEKSAFQDENEFGFQRTEEIFKDQKIHFTSKFRESKPQYLKYAEKLINEDGTGEVVDDINSATIILQDTKEKIENNKENVQLFQWEQFINFVIPKRD